MKKALVLSLFVMLGVGVACSAQFQGTWDTWLGVGNLTGTPTIDFYSYLDVQYLVGGWTLEVETLIYKTGLEWLMFEGYGALGAFSAWSLVYFDANSLNPAFLDFENAAEVSIAGVDIYALFAIQDKEWLDWWYNGGTLGHVPTGDYGTGFALGAIGTAGDIRIGAEVTSNLYPQLWFVFLYGLFDGVADWTNQYCASTLWYPVWSIGSLGLIQSSCDTVFSYLTFIAEFPLCCADIYTYVEFTCADGFNYLSFLAKNIDIGLDWLKIYELGITYAVDSKAIGYEFQIVTGDVVCFTPYLESVWDDDGTMLDGIQLNALTLSCTLGGCEFFWGHIFDPYMVRYAGWMWPTLPQEIFGTGPYIDDYRFAAVGGSLIRYPLECAFSVANAVTKVCVGSSGTTTTTVALYPNEVFGITCDEDSCCGGLFSFSMSHFFWTGDIGWDDTVGYDPAHPTYGCTYTLVGVAADYTGIFGWFGSWIEVSVGVGSNIGVSTGVKVTAKNGVEAVKFGFEVAW